MPQLSDDANRILRHMKALGANAGDYVLVDVFVTLLEKDIELWYEHITRSTANTRRSRWLAAVVPGATGKPLYGPTRGCGGGA
jgi:hypothetical protein